MEKRLANVMDAESIQALLLGFIFAERKLKRDPGLALLRSDH
jgi:hypothetical protein